MPAAHSEQGAETDSPPPSAEPRSVWGRRAAIAVAAVFVVSSAFPVAAGLSHDTASFPHWWGALDVAIAFLLAALVFVLFALVQGGVNKQIEEAGYRAYRILIHGIFVALAAFALLGDRIVWQNCLTGLAWRYWLLLYIFPTLLAALGGDKTRPSAISPR